MTENKPAHFIRQIIAEDIANKKNDGRVHTRFPPEPNGYLHVGHAKSICLNFTTAAENQGGLCNLRFDDTNPVKEDEEYVDSIKADVEWLGFNWAGDIHYASDYFDQLFDYAMQLVKKGKAYVDDLSPDEIRAYRGTLKEPGKDSPFRERSVEESVALFERMRAGEFDEGACVLRAKIDMSSPNINMRDPIIYRIRKVSHHQTGDKWCIYPMYDFTHCLSDSIEGITHSLCTLEFEAHRPLYDWVLDELEVHHPQQIEFGRLNLNYTVTSKRKLKELVDADHVQGWDDPRLPTISGLRRRGYTPESIRHFCEAIGITRSYGTVDMGMLEFSIREDLNEHSPRAMCVLNPVKIVIENYDDGKVEEVSAPNHPQNEQMGQRSVPFTREILIDRDDFREEANKKYKRLVLGKEVRLRNAYVIKAEDVVKDENGEIIEIRCSYDPETLGKNPSDGRKVKGVIHWVSATESVPCEVRLYDRLFDHENPDGDKEVEDFKEHLNKSSLAILTNCYVEKSLAGAEPEARYQFEREGYFCVDSKDSSADKLVFNKTVGLRDSWAKTEQR